MFIHTVTETFPQVTDIIRSTEPELLSQFCQFKQSEKQQCRETDQHASGAAARWRTLSYTSHWWHTLAHISSAYSIVFCRYCPLNKEGAFSNGASLPQLKTRRNTAGNFSSRRCRVKWYVGEGCLISTTRMLVMISVT